MRLQIFKITILIFLSVNSAFAEVETVGATYDIVEPDVLKEIKNKAKNIDIRKEYLKNKDKWTAFKSEKLPPAKVERERKFKPYYIVEKSIHDQYGNILYPEGYKYNPLDYVKMPWRIVVIGDSEREFEWLLNNKQPTDKILIAGGNPITTGKRLGKPVFIVNKNAKERLRLEYTPSIVKQVNDELIVSEIHVPEL